MDPVEVWVGASFVGSIVSTWSFNHACGDFEVARDNGGKRFVALLAIFRELGRILIQVPNLALGVHALPLSGQIEWTVTLVVLTLTPIILLVNSLLDAAGRVTFRP